MKNKRKMATTKKISAAVISLFLIIMMGFGLFLSGIFSCSLKDAFKNADLSYSQKNSDAVCLPIIMYHGLVKEKSLQNTYFIDPVIFKNDLDYLQKNGYNTILTADLISYIEGDVTLPKNPILLTFDDGFYNNYLYAYPLLREYNMKAVISVIGKSVDEFSNVNDRNEYYAHFTWKDIYEMVQSGNIEIQNHTYNLHLNEKGRKGALQKRGESKEDYKALLTADIMLLQNKLYECTGSLPTTFAYPYGAYNDNTAKFSKEMGFKVTLTCREGINYITKDEECLYGLKRYLRPPNKSSDEFFEQIKAQVRT